MELSFCAQYFHHAGDVVRSHAHTCTEFVFYGHGCRGMTRIGKEEFPFCAGTVAVNKEGVTHSEAHTGNGIVRFFGVYGDVSVKTGVYGDMWSIGKQIEEIDAEIRKQESDYREMIALKIKEITIRLARRGNAVQTAERDLTFFRQYMKENYMYPLSLTALSAQAGYSPDYFRHLYKKTFGVAPKTELVRWRLGAAEKLLEEGVLSCTDIALECGFSDGAQMSRMFRTYLGKTPKSFKTQKKE